MKNIYLLLLALLMMPLISPAQDGFNYDEDKVPAYTLPDPLVFPGGKKVKTVKQWEQKRRPQIFRLFEDQVYGKIPAGVQITQSRIVEESTSTPYKNARRKQVELLIKKGNRELIINMLIYLPLNRDKAPLFLGLNFYGNHTVTKDVEVKISDAWTRNNASVGIINNQLTEQSRGTSEESWQVQKIIDAGFGVATIFCGDIDPDRDDFSDGIHPFAYAEGVTKPGNGEWGTIAAWAWGLSKALDYLETDPQVDARHVAVIGHSRLGKAAIWAGAVDQRFALVVSNNSGCGGAAISRRKFGETVKRINTSFPHWFCTNFKAYNDLEENLPVDQHQLIALIAPRPVYIASAQEDLWADPKGEFLSGYHASPVYALYGLEGLTNSTMPGIHQPVMNRVGYHIRAGKHAITEYDWQQYLQFANKHFFDGKR